MSTELLPVARKFRKAIPDSHRTTLDTRIVWLWHQRFGTVQMVWSTCWHIPRAPEFLPNFCGMFRLV